ncbi:membrane protein [Bacteroidia bacterium]|nr:membrane protein [Bacteroidia bacterium]
MKKGGFHIVALLVVAIWGSTFVSTKILLNYGLLPQDIFFYRFLMAYIGIWTFGKSRLFAKNLKDEFLLLLLGVSGGSLYFLAENMALQFTLASNVALIVCTTPILTALLSRLFLKTVKLGRFFVHGSLLALCGVALVIFNGHFVLQLHPVGDFLCLVAALAWAVYIIVIKHVDDRYSNLFITRKVFFYGLLTILPVFIFKPLELDFTVLLQPVVLGNLVFLGLAASLACFFLWNVVIKKIGVVQSTNYLYINPIVTLITSAIFLDERITLMALGGAGLVLGGVVLASKINSRMNKTKIGLN